MGWEAACKADAGLAEGVNIVDGKITFKGVAEAFNLPYSPL
jgi:alanine dehydrogenase